MKDLVVKMPQGELLCQTVCRRPRVGQLPLGFQVRLHGSHGLLARLQLQLQGSYLWDAAADSEAMLRGMKRSWDPEGVRLSCSVFFLRKS